MTKTIDSHIVFLATRDLPMTAAFYEKTIGLTLALDQGKCRIYQVAEAAYLGFCTKDEISPRDGVIVTLVTRDVDEWYEQLRAKGVEFEKAPAYNSAKVSNLKRRRPIIRNTGSIIAFSAIPTATWWKSSALRIPAGNKEKLQMLF